MCNHDFVNTAEKHYKNNILNAIKVPTLSQYCSDGGAIRIRISSCWRRQGTRLSKYSGRSCTESPGNDELLLLLSPWNNYRIAGSTNTKFRARKRNITLFRYVSTQWDCCDLLSEPGRWLWSAIAVHGISSCCLRQPDVLSVDNTSWLEAARQPQTVLPTSRNNKIVQYVLRHILTARNEDRQDK